MKNTQIITVFLCADQTVEVYQGEEQVEVYTLEEFKTKNLTFNDYVEQLRKDYPDFIINAIASAPENTVPNTTIIKRVNSHYSKAQMKLMANLDEKAKDYYPKRVRTGQTQLTETDYTKLRYLAATNTVVKIGGSLTLGFIFGKSYIAIAGITIGSIILYDAISGKPMTMLADKVLIHK